jgi:hypothetical protein
MIGVFEVAAIFMAKPVFTPIFTSDQLQHEPETPLRNVLITPRFQVVSLFYGAEAQDNETEDCVQVSVRSHVYFHGACQPQTNLSHVGVLETTQLKPLRGFDRLMAAGFGEEDIANVRRQFHGSRLPGNTDGEDGTSSTG